MTSAAGPAPGGPSYRERLTPSWWIWACAPGLGFGVALSVAKISISWGAVTALVVTAVLLALLVRSTPSLRVSEGVLTAGRASIPVRLTGPVEVLDAEAMRRAHGPRLDARAHLCLRGWIPTGVRVALSDPQDPTPYWLLSSRRPETLAAALRATAAQDA
jgi:hypothetical protein